MRPREQRIAGRIALALGALGVLGAATLALAVLGWRYPTERLAPLAASSLRVLDREGHALRQRALPGGGHASWVALPEVPPLLVAATLAGEDRRYFDHPGVDAAALLRAFALDLASRRAAYGGSTVTMQLVRLVDPHPRSLPYKVGDAVRALRLERSLSKAQILEQYLNRAYYGNGAFGVDAAARLYFDRPASALADGEAVLLAALPRAPSGYDPHRHLEAALGRRRHLLDLMVAQGRLDAEARRRIEATPLQLVNRRRTPFLAPHFVDHVLAQLPAAAREGGAVVHTTLDGALQERVEQAVERHLAALADEGRNVQHAGVVVLDGRSGAVRAMVGSAAYGDDGRSGQLNILTTPRNPGSALKPFVYALALEAGDHPATIAWDVADVRSAYATRNADGRQHGPVRYRQALACSYNLAAVHVAERVGVPRLLERLRRAGLRTLDRGAADYGPALALGNGPVRLLDLAAAYGFLVNEGEARPAYAIERVELPGGAGDTSDGTRPRAAPTRLFSPAVSWLTMDMLADADARRPAFGDDLPLDLPFPAAAKTGTSGGFADNVTVIATRELIVLAWAGNFDGSPMHEVLAMRGAAPLARAAILAAADGRALTLPGPPVGVVERHVCALSGMAPGPACPHKREHFAAGGAPEKPCTWHRVDAATGAVSIAWPPEVRPWARRHRVAGGRPARVGPP